MSLARGEFDRGFTFSCLSNVNISANFGEKFRMSAGDWCLLESDPGLFSALIREFGCTGAQVDELWGLEPEVFKGGE